MKGPAASHPAPTVKPFPRPRGGTWRSAIQSIAFAALFVTGLDLWLTGQQRLVLWAHVLIGLGLLALLACWLVLLTSGIVMALPGALWMVGLVWFPERPVTETLSLIHFWASWLAMGGLILHLTMRHWGRKWG